MSNSSPATRHAVSDLPTRISRSRLPLATQASGFLPSIHSASPSDDEVLTRIRRGDVRSYRAIVRRYEERVFRVARSVLPSDEEAVDVVVDTFVDAVLELVRSREQARLSTLLSRVALSLAVGRARRTSRLFQLAVRLAGLFDEKGEEGRPRDPEHDARARVDAVLRELPTTARLVLVLRDVEGMSTAETADCLAMSEESIRVRYLRARAYLHGRVAPVDRRLVDDMYAFPMERRGEVTERVLVRLRTGAPGRRR